MSRNRYRVRYLVDNIELFDRDLIDFVETINTRYVDSIALDDVDEIVDSCVTSDYDICVVDSILAQDRLDRVEI